MHTPFKQFAADVRERTEDRVGVQIFGASQTAGLIGAGLTDVSAAYDRKYFEVQNCGTMAPFFSVYFHL